MPNRYDIARSKGITDRAINLPKAPRTNDEYALQAERDFLARYGLKAIAFDGPTSCDYRYTFRTSKGPQVACLDVKWTPLDDGGLLVAQEKVEKHRCLAYVLVTGDPDKGEPMTVRGWEWGFVLERHYEASRFKVPSYYLPQEALRTNPDILMAATFHVAPL